MALWIESHTILIRLRKLKELAKELRLRPAHLMGHLHALWHAALEQSEDGDLSHWSDETIADYSDYPGDAPQYVRLLQKHGWLDGKILHDWLDYAGRYLESKYRVSNPDRLRKIWAKFGREFTKTAYSKNTEGWTATRIKVLERDLHTCQYCGVKDVPFEIDHILPVAKGGTNDIKNLATACKSCNRSKGARIKTVLRQSEDDPPYLTLPYPTKPNPTKPNKGLERSDRTIVAVAPKLELVQARPKNGNGNNLSRPDNQTHEILDRVVEFADDEHSRAFYQKALNVLGPGLLEEAMGEVKMREGTGELTGRRARAKYLGAVLIDWMENRGL